jgi:hypothetical protein
MGMKNIMAPNRNNIGRITTAGVVINEFPVPTAGSEPEFITAGPAHSASVWFTELLGNKSGRSPRNEAPLRLAGSRMKVLPASDYAEVTLEHREASSNRRKTR